MAQDKTVRRERFENVAGRRVQAILDSLDRLSNCSNRNNYEYSEGDVRKMFSTIREKVKRIELMYEDEVGKKTKKKFQF